MFAVGYGYYRGMIGEGEGDFRIEDAAVILRSPALGILDREEKDGYLG